MEVKLTDKVETRDHRSVRLLATDVNNARPIAGIITNLDGTEFACTWLKDGMYTSTPWPEQGSAQYQGPLDLVVVPRTATCWLLAYRIPFEHGKCSFATFKQHDEAISFLQKGMFCKFALQEVTVTQEPEDSDTEAVFASIRGAQAFRREFEGQWDCTRSPRKKFSGWAVFEKDGPYRGVDSGQLYDTIEAAQAQIRRLANEDRMNGTRVRDRFVVFAQWEE